jgi:UDP-N-acetylmuramoylalanine--D-glutamate ligase
MTFGLDAASDFGLRDGWLVEGSERILRVKELTIHGAHNISNALAASALARAFGVPREALAAGLRSFRGLPHRLELVRERQGVQWYDDSKGTNVGATIAALRGLGRKAVVILGGDGKGQDFSPLRPAVQERASRVLLIGRDAPLIEAALAGLPAERCTTLEAAVQRASDIARSGEAVLLSPACASFDMFRDYKHRGEVFAAAVKALA